jgi:hypothetical protein
MGGNEGGGNERRVGEAGNGAHAEHQGKRESHGAISPDLTVAHDRELALDACARAEAVGGVGKAIFMQATGEEERGRDSENAADKSIKTERVRDPVDERTGSAYAGADDWKRPTGAEEIVARRGLGANREARQEG